MPLNFNLLLAQAVPSLKDVRILRHADRRSARGRTPYWLWRNQRDQFDLYQSTQSSDEKRRKSLAAPYWASFVCDPFNNTLFVGLYRVGNRRLLEVDTPELNFQGITQAGTADVYELELMDAMSEFIGKLYIDWGSGTRSWVQYADRNEKIVTELRATDEEPPFPGFLRFIEPLSRIPALPSSWSEALKAARGIYLLTCPRTQEQYVGSACGEDGFGGRWNAYCENGHGGDIALKSREPSDYQVSILEVAGSSATSEDILKAEGLWQTKLQSREMGLNRNLAHSA